ncbi:MAG TPA: ABC transporter ATP-binding protein [Myxococcota bacterium]
MATFSEHENAATAEPGRSVFFRLLRYARPYVLLILFTSLLVLGYSGARYARAYLAKPLLDNVVLPHGALTDVPKPTDWLPRIGPWAKREHEAAAEKPAAVPLTNEERSKLERQVQESFTRIVMVAVMVVFAMPFFMFTQNYLVEWVLGRIMIDMKRDVCSKLLALPLRFHQDRRRGDVLTRTMADVGAAHGALSLVFGELIQQAVMICVGLPILFFISWRLALVSLILGPMLIGVISIFGRRIRESARRRQEKYADVTQRLLEILSGIKVIKAFRAESLEDRAFRRETRRLFTRSMQVARYRVFARSLVEMLNNAMGVAMLGLGAMLVLRGRFGLTVGDVAAFATVLTTTYKPVKGLAKDWVKLMDAQPSAERFYEVMDTKIDVQDAQDAVQVGPLRSGVKLTDVCFSYGREPVLDRVSFEARAGEVVAIVGRTGAGKTTLIDLLMRFYDPDSGSIEYDGIDLRRVERDSLLAQIAVVGQEPFLFDASIRENLLYGRPNASDQQILAAAHAAHVDEFVTQLPEGYGTEVGSVGVRLSGGQRQRITIARAILRDPSILIFDEATSSLDSKSEKYVQDAIDALLGGHRTVFVIAHRLSTIRRADKIVVLENGTVSQVGTHAELIRAGGLYRDLIELQMTARGPAESSVQAH